MKNEILDVLNDYIDQAPTIHEILSTINSDKAQGLVQFFNDKDAPKYEIVGYRQEYSDHYDLREAIKRGLISQKEFLTIYLWCQNLAYYGVKKVSEDSIWKWTEDLDWKLTYEEHHPGITNHKDWCGRRICYISDDVYIYYEHRHPDDKKIYVSYNVEFKSQDEWECDHIRKWYNKNYIDYFDNFENMRLLMDKKFISKDTPYRPLSWKEFKVNFDISKDFRRKVDAYFIIGSVLGSRSGQYGFVDKVRHHDCCLTRKDFAEWGNFLKKLVTSGASNDTFLAKRILTMQNGKSFFYISSYMTARLDSSCDDENPEFIRDCILDGLKELVQIFTDHKDALSVKYWPKESIFSRIIQHVRELRG